MPNPASNFRMVSDKVRSGLRYWRVYFPDPANPKSTKKLSTGIVDDGSKSRRLEAEALALSVLDKLKSVPAVDPDTLEALGKDFWTWNKSPYLKALLARDAKAIGPEHAANQVSNWKRHIEPYVITSDGRYRGRKLVQVPASEITPDMLDDLVTYLLDDKRLSAGSVKHIINALSPIFQRAISKRKIVYNPVRSMLPFGVRYKVRDAFTPEEARKLLNTKTVDEVWADQARRHVKLRDGWCHYAMSLLVASTAARWAMVAALDREDIREAQWNGERYFEVTLDKGLAGIQGVKPGSKTGTGTVVPIAAELMDLILPHLPAAGPLFPSWGIHGRISHNTAIRALHLAMTRIKISGKEQEARLLGFHSWRHTWETRARAAGLTKEIRQNFTEHRQEETGDGYAHLKPFELLGALPLQRALVG